ncbi:trans-hexaprenyltranstransferase [Agrocybe pediades]|nr:trans-hexaprenyltranstransferase [Agrocybe pediades]
MRPTHLRSISNALPVTRCQRRRLGVLAQHLEPTATRSRPETIPLQAELPNTRRNADPYVLVGAELTHIRKNMLNLLGSAHPGLADMAEYYFLHPSKQLRSLLVLLFSRATNGLGRRWETKHSDAVYESTSGQSEILDRPLKRPNVLNEWNPSMPDHTASFEHVFPLQQSIAPTLPPFRPPSAHPITSCLVSPPFLLPTQIRLAQIVEMIHVASSLHENIANTPEEEENGFGNKLSILGGDFLLGRASTALSRLGESEVVELVASVISNLVEGEILSMAQVKTPELGLIQGPTNLRDAWDAYLRKTYLKTASLMAKGARSAVILGGSQEEVWSELAYAYGRNLGIAYQLVEDAADIRQIQPGLASAPALYASATRPEMLPLIKRNFTSPGDTQLAAELMQNTPCVDQTLELARKYALAARHVLGELPESEARTALETLTDTVVERSW